MQLNYTQCDAHLKCTSPGYDLGTQSFSTECGKRSYEAFLHKETPD